MSTFPAPVAVPDEVARGLLLAAVRTDAVRRRPVPPVLVLALGPGPLVDVIAGVVAFIERLRLRWWRLAVLRHQLLGLALRRELLAARRVILRVSDPEQHVDLKRDLRVDHRVSFSGVRNNV